MAETISDLLSYLHNVRAGAETQSYFDGVTTYVLDPQEINRLLLIANAARFEDPTAMKYTIDQLGVINPLTNAQFISFVDGLIDRTVRYYEAEGVVAELINNLTVTEYADVITEFQSAFDIATARALLPHQENITELAAAGIATDEMVIKTPTGFGGQTAAAAGKAIMACHDMSALVALVTADSAAIAALGAGMVPVTTSVNGLMTAADKVKLNGIATGATNTAAPVNADWSSSSGLSQILNKPSIPSVTRTTSNQSMSLVGSGATGTQISATKDSSVRFTCSTQVTYSLTGSPASVVVLKICATNDATEGNWTTVASTATRQPTGLAVTIGQVVNADGQICADVPAGWYVKLVNSGSGTHSESFVAGQKTIYG